MKTAIEPSNQEHEDLYPYVSPVGTFQNRLQVSMSWNDWINGTHIFHLSPRKWKSHSGTPSETSLGFLPEIQQEIPPGILFYSIPLKNPLGIPLKIASGISQGILQEFVLIILLEFFWSSSRNFHHKFLLGVFFSEILQRNHSGFFFSRTAPEIYPRIPSETSPTISLEFHPGISPGISPAIS